MAHARVEEVRVLFLNAKNMLIANEALWQGSVDEASVHVREVIARAIALGATALIIVHNHPSGDPSPSQQDIRLARPGRSGATYEGDGPRPCDRRRERPDEYARNGTDLGIDRGDPDRPWRRALGVRAGVVEPDLAVADHQALIATEQTVELLVEDRLADLGREDLIVIRAD